MREIDKRIQEYQTPDVFDYARSNAGQLR